MALHADTRDPETIPDIWLTVTRRLVDPAKERMHEVEMLASLLLVGVYEAESARSTASRMRGALLEVLNLTTGIADEFHRRRRVRAWLGAGRAVLGCDDVALAESIASAIARDLRDLRTALEGPPWRDPEGYGEVFAVGQTWALPESQTRIRGLM